MPNPAGRPRVYGDVTLICQNPKCEKPFTMRGGVARGYEKKHGRPKPYCSMQCFYEAVNRHAYDPEQAAPTYVCEGCGGTFARRADVTVDGVFRRWDIDQKYHSSECFHTNRFAQFEAQRDQGIVPGGFISKDGYHIVKMGHGKNVKMHRIVMERILGRPLRENENVHHINGQRADNRPENLELWVKTQPCGQRVDDRIDAALALLDDYPELVARRGRRIVSTEGDGDMLGRALEQHETS